MSVQAGFAALTGQRDGRFAMTPFFSGLWAAIAASGLVAALLHGSAAFPASALADHRSETLACALDELGVPAQGEVVVLNPLESASPAPGRRVVAAR